jgi:hypothetical protein
VIESRSTEIERSRGCTKPYGKSCREPHAPGKEILQGPPGVRSPDSNVFVLYHISGYVNRAGKQSRETAPVSSAGKQREPRYFREHVFYPGSALSECPWFPLSFRANMNFRRCPWRCVGLKIHCWPRRPAGNRGGMRRADLRVLGRRR